MGRPKLTLIQLAKNLMSRIERTEDDCWRWTKTIGTTGYGFSYLHGRPIKTHRLSYLLFRGPLIPGMFICHKCDNKWCVNPGHLYQGTVKDNVRDAQARGQMKIAKPKPGYAMGEKHCCAKLNNESAKKIIELRRSGFQYKEIAKELGVHLVTVADVIKGKTWKHITKELR